MWLLLGAGAIVCAAINLIWSFQDKDSGWPRFASLSFTCLTLCAFYADGAARVRKEDWAGLADIMPMTNVALWICVILSIVINAVPFFIKEK